MSDPRPTDHAAQTPKSGHDAKGRWAKGNPGGPGNPFARQVAKLRKVIINRLTEEDLLAITEALLAKAKEGSVGAAKLLLAYGIGKPASAPDPDRLDGQELKHFKEQVEVVNDVHELAREVGKAVDKRLGLGGVSEDFSALLRQMSQHSDKYDNPACLQAVANVLNESDTGAGAWVLPSTTGLFAGLPERIRELSQALFVVEEPDPEDLYPEESYPVEPCPERPTPQSPSPNGDLRPPEQTPGD